MFPSRRITVSGGDKFEDYKSLFLDGTGDNAGFAIDQTYDIHNREFSFCFWFKRTSYSWQRILSNKDSTGNYKFLLIGQEADKEDISLEGNTDNKRIKTDQHEGNLNTWYHIVVTTDGSGSGAFYENGKPLALATDGSSTNNLDTAITIKEIGNALPGYIADLSIYSTDIGKKGAQLLYNEREPYNHKEGQFSKNLINWWRMGDGYHRNDMNVIFDQVSPKVGSDIVTNGGFDADNTWHKGTGWSIGSGVATLDGSNSGYSALQHILDGADAAIANNRLYRCRFDWTRSAGVLQFKASDPHKNITSGTSGSEDFVFISDGTSWYFTGSPSTSVTIDNVIIEPLNADLSANLLTNPGFSADSNWNKNSNWTITGGVAVSDGTSTNNINQNLTGVIQIGKTYRVSIDIASLNSGDGYAIRLGDSGDYSETFNTVGTHTVYQVCTGSNAYLYLNAVGDADGTIDNIVVQELKDSGNPGLLNADAKITGDVPW